MKHVLNYSHQMRWMLLPFFISKFSFKGPFIWAEVAGSSRLPSKHFDKFTSEISPCYEIIWKVVLRSYGTKSFPGYRNLACWQARSRWPRLFLSHMNTTFPLSGKTFCLHFTKSTSQRETLSGNRENISPYEQNKIVLTCRNVFSATEITSAHMNRP